MLQPLIDTAIDIEGDFEPLGGYHLAFSGGKILYAANNYANWQVCNIGRFMLFVLWKARNNTIY